MLDLLNLFDPGTDTNFLLHSQFAFVPLLLVGEDLSNYALHLEAHPGQLSGPEFPFIQHVIIELVTLFLEHLHMSRVVKTVYNFDFTSHYIHKAVKLPLK